MKKLILKLIRFYQKINPQINVCRFKPTCSNYSYQAIEKYGIINGSWISFKRIIKCHPWNRGGKDPLK